MIFLRSISVSLAVALLTLPAFAATADDARKHMVRGMAAIEMAKSEEELSAAAEEFRRATEIAPEMAAAWYNLGSVQVKLGQLMEAMASYRRYLALSPDASDAQKIEDEITKLEYRLEKSEKFKSRGGIWIDKDGYLYALTTDNGKIQLQGTRMRSRNDIEYSDVMLFDFGGLGNLGYERVTIRLDARGSKLAGVWEAPAGKIYPSDVCTVPAEKGEVEGSMDDREGKITLRLMRAKYRIVQVEPPLGSRSCQEVSVIENRPVEMAFFGPLPDGGVRYASVNDKGNFTVHRVDKGSNEEAEGIEEGDEILSIDGTRVEELSSIPEKVRRLRGEVGTTCRLALRRPGGVFSSEKTLTVTHKRSDLRK